MPRRLLRSARLVASLTTVLACRAHAQAVDIIRGRITGPDSAPVAAAAITITTPSGDRSRAARSDANGRYSVAFPGDEGDYWISVAAFGFNARRFEVKRVSDEAVLIGDARLTLSGLRLAPMQVQASRQRVSRNDSVPDVGGSERTVNFLNLSTDQAGNVAAMAASMPGVQFIPGNGGNDGFSLFGLGPDQNAVSLNGLLNGPSTLPRDADVSVSVASSPYDVSIGGFSGGRLAIRTRPGSNFVRSTSSAVLATPSLQWTDRAGDALGQRYQNASVSGLASGPIRLNESFYNLSYQIDRRANDIHSLLNTDPAGLQAAGIAPDSAARLLGALRQAGIPSTVGAVPSQRVIEHGQLLGSLDFNPPLSLSGATYNVTFNGNWSRQAPVGASVTELPSHESNQMGWNGALQARHTGFFGALLSETSVGVSQSHTYNDPFLALPSGTVQMTSELADGTLGVSTVSVGGSPFSSVGATTSAAQFVNQLSWYSMNSRHRLRLSVEAMRSAYAQDLTVNSDGTFAFNSIADLASGRAASFTRTLEPRVTRAAEYAGAVSLGDYYKMSDALQLQYGVRLDANRFADAPAFNADVDRLFGVRTSSVPNGAALSPRVGFSWKYGSSPEITGVPDAARAPRAVVRGGVGMFQGWPATTAIGNALSNTGLASAVQQLTCVGSATPAPAWLSYAKNGAGIPTTCADGSTGSVFANTAPPVTLFDPRFAPPRSLRSNLQWAGPLLDNRISATLEGVYSLNLDQSGTVDLNFAPRPQFVVTDEGNRPVYTEPSSIVPGTGAIAAGDARVSSLFSKVTELRSDLRSETRQLSIRIQPSRPSTSRTWSLAYVYQNVRDDAHGFASAAGDPTVVEWARGALDSRHQIVYTLGYDLADWFRINWFGQFRSGLPFTPTVAGDVNGDGYSNDRAFVFDPAKTADTALASGMSHLLAHGSASARDCLRRQLGQIAARNSCEAPWSSAATLSVGLNPIKLRLPSRTSLSLQLSNPLAAADLALHGEGGLHGWGQTPMPSAQLLSVRGFDPVSRHFVYDVNERFGATAPAQSAFRTPITLSAIVRVDLGPTRERQSLTQLLDRGRTTPGTKVSEGALKQTYANGGLFNPLAALLREADSLRLSSAQADSVAVLNQSFTVSLDSIWAPVAQYLASLPDEYDAATAYNRYVAAREQTVDRLIALTPQATSQMTADQRRRLSAALAMFLDPVYLRSIRSGTAGFGGLNGNPAAPVAGGGGSVVARP